MTKKIQHKVENGVETKYCGKCKIYKELIHYGYSGSTWDNLRSTCKDCLKEDNIKNKEKRTAYNKQYWEETKEQQKKKNKVWRENNKEYIKEKMKEWLDNNKEYKKQKDKEYRAKNYEKYKEYHKIWAKQNYNDMKTNPERQEEFIRHKIKKNTARRIREMLGFKKSDTTLYYVGCTLDQFKQHLESKFQENMNWENYGSAWHIDHIIPCNAFNFLDEKQVKACFHYKNLQPLWATENIIKKDKYTKDNYDKYLDDYGYEYDSDDSDDEEAFEEYLIKNNINI